MLSCNPSHPPSPDHPIIMQRLTEERREAAPAAFLAEADPRLFASEATLPPTDKAAFDRAASLGYLDAGHALTPLGEHWRNNAASRLSPAIYAEPRDDQTLFLVFSLTPL